MSHLDQSVVQSIPELLVRRIQASRDLPAIHVKIRDANFVSGYRTKSWLEVRHDIWQCAAGLRSLGVTPGSRVVQVSENRYEWLVVDLAIQLNQAIHVPAHAPLTGEQIAYQINDSDACLVLLSNEEQCFKLASVGQSLRDGTRFVSYDHTTSKIRGEPVPHFHEIVAGASEAAGETLATDAVAQLTPDHLATILYTSGTTGEPKGVMLTQGNLVSNSLATLEVFAQDGNDIRMCFLPLSHIFARTCDLYTWIAAGSQLALAESRDTVITNCHEVGPTLMNGVPYFFDKLRKSLIDDGTAGIPGAVRARLGGRMRYCCSGGAALPDHVFDFFQGTEVPVLQGYGLTESSPVITISNPTHFRRCAVGKSIPDVEIAIADDGEILTRGPHVMKGYWKKPEATAEVMLGDWLRTGDLGRIDDDGYLYITGRKKEILVTSGGKNVAPVMLESLLTHDPLIHQALVVGDGRNYLTALIVPDGTILKSKLVEMGITANSTAEVLSHPDVLALYERVIHEQLKGVSHYEQVRRFTLLQRPFTIESGEMTPKLSLRRKIIEANFAAEIARMYGVAMLLER